MTLKIYEHSKTVTGAQFLKSHAAINQIRRRLGVLMSHCDVWLSPTTADVAEPHGLYNQGLENISAVDYLPFCDRPVQFTFPHNVMGTPAISLPLAMHSNGLPIGVQLGGRPAEEHVLLQLSTILEQEMPWKGRMPVLHVSRT